MYIKKMTRMTILINITTIFLLVLVVVTFSLNIINALVLCLSVIVISLCGLLVNSLNAAISIKDLNSWYEQILDFVYLPMSITDMDMKWTFINKPVKDIIKVDREEVIGQHCSNWNADICGTEKCGIMMLRKGTPRSFFSNEGIDRNFQVDSTYLYDRRNKEKKIGHIELVSDVTTKVRLESAVAHLKSSSVELASTLEESAATTTEISATTEEFSHNIRSISTNTEKQYKIMEETVSGLEEMTASVQSVAGNATKASKASSEGVITAIESQTQIKETVKGISKLSTSLIEISDEISRLNTKTQAVDEILQVINSIANQTNLLSMNAAIEAAHAGDSGKGFSVVATEIRNLAVSSQASSKEIEQILGEIKKDVIKSLELSNAGRELVTENASTIESSMEALEKIVRGIKDINKIMTGIEATTKEQDTANAHILKDAKTLMDITNVIRDAVREQTSGIEQISEALLTLSRGTNQNSVAADGLMNIANRLSLG